jgi:soluble lytic murein transglycosylase-like protein
MNRVIQATRDLAASPSFQSSAVAVFARDTASGFVTTVHHTFMILGVSAIGALALMFVRPDITDQLKALSPFTLANAQEPAQLAQGPLPAAPATLTLMPASPAASVADAPNTVAANVHGSESNTRIAKPAATVRQQALVTNWLAKKYRVAGDATDMLVSAAYNTAQDIKLDPLLILSVMAIESGFNPFAESPVGAQGLMQVMSKVHVEKFQPLGGVKAALNPVANIKVGSLILKDYVTRGGSVEAGLKLYVGAAAFDSDFGYGSRVLAEYRRLKDVAVGKNVPLTTPTLTAKAKPVERAVEAPAAHQPDDSTTRVDGSGENAAKVASL